MRRLFRGQPHNRFDVGTRVRAVLLATAILAAVTFAVVQDRVTAAGARRYVALQQEAMAERGPTVTIDEVMEPAVDRSIRDGLLWASVVFAAGVGLAAIVFRRT